MCVCVCVGAYLCDLSAAVYSCMAATGMPAAAIEGCCLLLFRTKTQINTLTNSVKVSGLSLLNFYHLRLLPWYYVLWLNRLVNQQLNLNHPFLRMRHDENNHLKYRYSRPLDFFLPCELM